MLKVSIKGILKEIVFKSDKSCKFIIENEAGELLCTLTIRRISIVNELEKGKEYSLDGYINLYRKVTKVNQKHIEENVFYVDEIIKCR